MNEIKLSEVFELLNRLKELGIEPKGYELLPDWENRLFPQSNPSSTVRLDNE